MTTSPLASPPGLDHVVLVLVEQVVCAQRRHQVMEQQDVGRVVERRALGEQAHVLEDLLGLLVTGFRQLDLVTLLVDPEVALGLRLVGLGLFLHAVEQRRHRVHADIQFRMVLGLTADDQRRARLVDQDRVHLVDDGVREAALHALAGLVDHVVAQVIEAELVVGAVRDVGRVRLLLQVVRHLRQVDPDRQPQIVVEPTHPLGIALREVVVDRDQMDALPGQGVEVDRQGPGQRLALAGPHLGDLAFVQREPADQLHVEVPHPERALRRLAHGGEGLGQQRLERLAGRVPGLELVRLILQRVVGQRRHGGLERVDVDDRPPVLLQQSLVATAEDFLEDTCQHGRKR